MNKIKREEIFKILSKERAKPKTELNYSSCFELLIAVILSAQTTDIAVNKITYKLFKKLKTPQSFIKFGEKNLNIGCLCLTLGIVGCLIIISQQ